MYKCPKCKEYNSKFICCNGDGVYLAGMAFDCYSCGYQWETEDWPESDKKAKIEEHKVSVDPQWVFDNHEHVAHEMERLYNFYHSFEELMIDYSNIEYPEVGTMNELVCSLENLYFQSKEELENV